MDIKYIRNQTETTAQIYLFDTIGGGKINAQNFVNELQFLDSLGLEEINVHINSGGGSVLEGYGIFSAIRNAKTTVNTHIDGIAASIAGIIAMAGNKRTIADFGRLMIHDPSFGGSNAKTGTNKVLDSIKASLITILTNNSNLDEGAIFDVMSEETWLNAEEAFGFGFVDSISNTQRQKEEIQNLAIEDVQNIANELITPIQTTNTKTNKMLNLVNHLSLTEGATEEEILNSVKSLENKVLDAEVKVEEVNNELTSVKEAHVTELGTINNSITEKDNAIADLNKTVATMTVENAISEGKLSKENKAELIEQATNNLEGFKTLLNSVKTQVIKPTDLINKTDESTPSVVTFTEMSKNNPNGLLNLMNTDKEAYIELYKNEFGTIPNL
jgi:ATP-dependent protease ClpP protease subunit